MTTAASIRGDVHPPPPDETVQGSVQERVLGCLSELSKAESRVAHALLAEYPLAGLETVAKLASRAATSGPTILRFTSRLGFATYAEFQDALRTEVHLRLQGPLARYPLRSEEPAGRNIFRDVAHALRRNMEQIEVEASTEILAQIVERLCDEERAVVCLGGRFSWMTASYLHHYLRELRPGVRIIRDGSAAWADDLVDLQPGDLLVVFDFRRYQPDVLEFTRGARAQGAEIVLVTDVWYSPIAAAAHFTIPCPVSLPTAFDSGVSGLAVVEMLVAGVVDAMGARAMDRIAAIEDLRRSTRLGS